MENGIPPGPGGFPPSNPVNSPHNAHQAHLQEQKKGKRKFNNPLYLLLLPIIVGFAIYICTSIYELNGKITEKGPLLEGENWNHSTGYFTKLGLIPQGERLAIARVRIPADNNGFIIGYTIQDSTNIYWIKTGTAVVELVHTAKGQPNEFVRNKDLIINDVLQQTYELRLAPDFVIEHENEQNIAADNYDPLR